MSELAQHETPTTRSSRASRRSSWARNLNSAGAAARERDRVLLPRVRLRVLLSPLARTTAALWHPKHVDTVGRRWGTLVMALTCRRARCSCGSGLADHRAGRPAAWRLKGGVALAARARGARAPGRRVDAQRLRSGGRRLRERLLRLDGVHTSSSCSARCSGSRPCSRRRSATARSRAAAPAPGEASGDPGRLGHDIARPALARPAAARGAVASTGRSSPAIAVLAWIVLYLV